MYVLKWTGLIAFGVFAALAVAGLRTGSFGAWVFIGLAIGTVIGAICVLIHAMGRKDAFFASDIRSAATSKKNSTKYRFVPVESSLHIAKGQDKPDIGTFKERSGLRTSVADNLFEKFIVPGNGNEMIDWCSHTGTPLSYIALPKRSSLFSVNTECVHLAVSCL